MIIRRCVGRKVHGFKARIGDLHMCVTVLTVSIVSVSDVRSSLEAQNWRTPVKPARLRAPEHQKVLHWPDCASSCCFSSPVACAHIFNITRMTSCVHASLCLHLGASVCLRGCLETCCSDVHVCKYPSNGVSLRFGVTVQSAR